MLRKKTMPLKNQIIGKQRSARITPATDHFNSSAGTLGKGIAGMYAQGVPKQSSFQKIAMSKPVGKVLDSRVGKKMVGVGNAVIKGVKRLGTFPDEGKLNKEKDARNRANAPVGAFGGTNRGEYRGR